MRFVVGQSNIGFLGTLSVGICRECVGLDRIQLLAVGFRDAKDNLNASLLPRRVAARFARRQASSEKAGEYAAQMKPYGELGWELVRDCKGLIEGGNGNGEKARL
jgi:hypothetical protein